MTNEFEKSDMWEFRYMLPSLWSTGEVTVTIIESVSEERAHSTFRTYLSQVLTDPDQVRVISVKCLWINHTNPKNISRAPELIEPVEERRTYPTSSSFGFTPMTPVPLVQILRMPKKKLGQKK